MVSKKELSKKFAQMYGAPILIPYIWWVLEESNRLGIKKLFFVARDGYVLKLIADILINYNKFEIETSYIYGSRRVWRVSYFLDENLNIIRFLDESYKEKIINIHKLSALFLITPEELETYLPEYYQKHQMDWTIKDIFLIQNHLNKSKKFKSYLCGRHTEFGERIKGYLLQELGNESEHFAFVESVGTGYTQGGLELFLDDNSSIETFYYYQHNKKGKRKFYSYIQDENKSSIMIELLCRACEGQTNDYRMVDGKYRPIFKGNEGEILEEYGYKAYFDEIRKILRQSINKKIGIEEETWDSFSRMKDKQMLRYIGDFPYGVTGTEHRVCTFAPRITFRELYHILFEGRIFTEQRYYSGALMNYSILRSGKIVRALVDFSESNKWLKRMQNRNVSNFEKRLNVDIIDIFPKIREKRVAIYGAGKIGSFLVKNILDNKRARLVLWMDQHPRNSALFPIVTPEEILNINFDYIIIAVSNWIISSEMKEKIENLGISSERVIG